MPIFHNNNPRQWPAAGRLTVAVSVTLDSLMKWKEVLETADPSGVTNSLFMRLVTCCEQHYACALQVLYYLCRLLAGTVMIFASCMAM